MCALCILLCLLVRPVGANPCSQRVTAGCMGHNRSRQSKSDDQGVPLLVWCVKCPIVACLSSCLQSELHVWRGPKRVQTPWSCAGLLYRTCVGELHGCYAVSALGRQLRGRQRPHAAEDADVALQLLRRHRGTRCYAGPITVGLSCLQQLDAKAAVEALPPPAEPVVLGL